jgi:hypothetical protein
MKTTQKYLEAKLSERKTVHEWLNAKGIPSEEFGKPICLLRRLSIAINGPPVLTLKTGHRCSIDGQEHFLISWGNWSDPVTKEPGIAIWFEKNDRK